MKILAVFQKSILEQLRSRWDLALTLVLGPVMILLYWAFFGGGGSTNYNILVVDENTTPCKIEVSQPSICAEQAIQSISNVTYANGESILEITAVNNREEAKNLLRNGKGTALLVFPDGFNRNLSISASATTPEIVLIGDLTNPYYPLAAIFSTNAVQDYVHTITRQPEILHFSEEALGGSATRSEFEIYVPGMLIVSVILMLYSISMAVAREIESGALQRLQLAHTSALEFLGGVSLLYAIVAILSILLTFATACALGFKSQGPLWAALCIGILTAFSIIGAGLITACFSRTVSSAAIIANFPLIIFMFFSGGIFPIPRLALFTIGGHSFALPDLLPPTHAVQALNKVLTLGLGLQDITFELGALCILSTIYFAAGIILFQRIHMRAR